ncbi:unnamed protein product [Closterium sp. NIES-54]
MFVFTPCSSLTRGAEPGGAETGGAELGGAETGVAEPEGVELQGNESEDADCGDGEPQGAASSGGSADASPRLSTEQLREWLVRRACLRSGATGAGGARDAGAGGAGVTAGAGGPGGACTRGTRAAGIGGVWGAGAGDPTEPGAAGGGGSSAGGAGAEALPLPPASPLHAPSPYTEQSDGLTERRSLHEEIWLRRPPGFTGLFPAGTQWGLFRPVYGLRQAPCEWHDTLRTTLAALGFGPSTVDPSLFLRTNTSLPPFYVLVYVDDLVFVKLELQKRHTCSDLGELRSYLGLQITRDRARRTITLTQSHMVHQVLQRFGFQFSLPQPTPLSTSHSLSAPPSDESIEPSGPYPELVGCLMYLMTCTRPDLVYPLSLLARYVAPGRHRKVHWDAAKRVLRYLCSTLGIGLVLGGRGPVVLTGHADASRVDDSATQRSSQGSTFSLALAAALRAPRALQPCCAPCALQPCAPCCPAALRAPRALLPSSPVRPAALQPCAPCYPAAAATALAVAATALAAALHAPCSPVRPARPAVLLPCAHCSLARPARPAALQPCAPCCPVHPVRPAALCTRHAQPPPPPPPPPPPLLLPPPAAGAAVGGRGSAAPAPPRPPPFSSIPCCRCSSGVGVWGWRVWVQLRGGGYGGGGCVNHPLLLLHLRLPLLQLPLRGLWGRLSGGSRHVASSASSPEATISAPVATVRAAPVARVSAASADASYLLSSHSPASSSLALCECL